MNRKFACSLALLMFLLFSSASFAFALGENYARVGISLGDTANYLISRTDIPLAMVNRMNLLVVNVTGVIVEFNVTLYSANGTRYTSFLQQGNVSRGDLSQYVIVPDLSIGDPIDESANAPTINESIPMVVMGGGRQVNHLITNMSGIWAEFYWDKETGLMVQSSDNSTGYWMNYTLVSTSIWSSVAKPIIMALVFLGGVSSLAIVAISLILYVRKK